MPDSERLTLSTSAACASIERFLWMTPSPPCWAIAIARRDSVTVSIAAEMIGIFNGMLAVSRVRKSTWRGCTRERPGRSRTSSKVRATGIWLLGAGERRRRVGITLLLLYGSVSGPDRCSGTVRRPFAGAVALLVLLARPAGTGVVAADLRCAALDGLDFGVLSARRGRAVGVVVVRRAPGRERDRLASLGRDLSLGLAHDRLEAEEVLHDLVLDALLHDRKELEGLLLVLD